MTLNSFDVEYNRVWAGIFCDLVNEKGTPVVPAMEKREIPFDALWLSTLAE
jgi:hypothetical protein